MFAGRVLSSEGPLAAVVQPGVCGRWSLGTAAGRAPGACSQDSELEVGSPKAEGGSGAPAPPCAHHSIPSWGWSPCLHVGPGGPERKLPAEGHTHTHLNPESPKCRGSQARCACQEGPPAGEACPRDAGALEVQRARHKALLVQDNTHPMNLVQPPTQGPHGETQLFSSLCAGCGATCPSASCPAEPAACLLGGHSCFY